tara:strand:+ start:88144 stop:88506 length:363 start_codon:yes stop_codon:yes gene_type:complete
MITLNLEQVFKARGIDKGYSFMIKHGISSSAAGNLLYRAPRSIRLKHIEILCKHLVCEPSDLFAYTPEKNEALNENHPLQKLIRDQAEANLKQAISNLSYQELIAITKNINDLKKEDKSH